MSHRYMSIWMVLPVVGLLLAATSTQIEHTTALESAAPPALGGEVSLRPAASALSRGAEDARDRQNTTTSIVDIIDTLAMTMSAIDTSRLPTSVWRVEQYPGGSVTVVLPMHLRGDETERARQGSARNNRSFWQPF